MNLVAIDIGKDPVLAKKVSQLYRQAFPKEERLPWWLLRLNTRRKGVDLTAWVEGDRFCGFTASVTVEKLHFLLFFAVAEEYRGQGYGSAVLSALKNTYQTVVLNVEPLLPQAENLDQRRKRFAFYEKNGFFDTGFYVWEIGGKFRVLSTTAELEVPAYKAIFKKFSMGFWNVKILRETE